MRKNVGWIILLLVCVFLIGTVSVAMADVALDATNFPDANFRKFVKDQFDKDGDGKLSDAEISAATEIDLSNFDHYHNGDITTVKGIELLSSLTKLDCSECQLTTLDVSKNTQLTELICSQNQLSELDVSKNTKLTKLDCSTNVIEAIDLSKNTALIILNVRHNNITNLNVSQNTKLVELDASGTELTTLDLSHNTELEKLYCENTNGERNWNLKLQELDLTHNTKLRELKLMQNHNLTKLDISKCAALEVVDLYAVSALETLDLSGNPNVVELDIPGLNKITSVDLSHNTKLEVLSCYYSQFTTVDLSHNTALKELWCFDSEIASLDLSKNVNLEILECRGCKLSKLDLSKLTKLRKLSCYENKITSLDITNCTPLANLVQTTTRTSKTHPYDDEYGYDGYYSEFSYDSANEKELEIDPDVPIIIGDKTYERFSVKLTAEKKSIAAGETWTVNYEIKGVDAAELANEEYTFVISFHKWAYATLTDGALIRNSDTIVNRYANQFRLTQLKGSVVYTPEIDDAQILEAELWVNAGENYENQSVYTTVTGATVPPKMSCKITMQQDTVKLGEQYTAKYEITGMSGGERDYISVYDTWYYDYSYEYDGEEYWDKMSHMKNGRELTAPSGALTAKATEGNVVGFKFYLYSDGWTLDSDESLQVTIPTKGLAQTDHRGWYFPTLGEYCYADENGYPTIGRAYLEDEDGEWYLFYFDEKGCAVKNGWITMPDGSIGYAYNYHLYTSTMLYWEDNWYAFDDNGALIIDDYVTGYVDATYYTDEKGILRTGLFESKGVTFYADDEGVLQNGLLTVNGNTYLFFYDGAQTGVQEYDGGIYYFGDKGVMQTGWITVENDTYYFDLKNGRAKTGKATIDGKEYTFSDKGVLQTGDQILPGDVDGNGEVDGRDVVRLMKYLADEIDPETKKVYEIKENNADVDGSGTVDAKDLLRLVKYFGGEKVTLEKGNVAAK